ncbi:S8 family peptidase [Bacillus pinisoli]|uniref:S8 family peptidase n=1 Tax=Bacillus pinisoli TaxID=2901866 RepID=UPI00234313E7|nr:S8 family serine peptidase [Bacillus pinisoli]
MVNTHRKFRSLLVSLVFLLSFSSFSLGAFANTNTSSPPELAELFGDINVSSSKLTTVIVELEEESLIEAKYKGKAQTKASLEKERKNVKAAVEKVAKSSKVNREYDTVFSGFSVTLASNEIPGILGIPGVKAVYPDVTYTVTGDAGKLVAEDAYSPNMFNSVPHIGVDEVWEIGFTGKGITVAVIDTGADYTHPDLAHAFGDYKGWDFVDNDNDPQETPVGDPRGEETAHGTHVSGTVAANGLIKGVAPDATLLAYRVLGPGGSGTTTNVVAGIERAVQDGADVMNLSLGNSLNNPDWATSIALDWAMAEGVVAVTSNGNSGPDNWTVGSPGTSRDAISVGATQLPYNVYNVETTTTGGVTYSTDKVMGFASDADLLALDGVEYEYVYVGLGSAEEFAGVDVKGKIALISRGAYAFVDKAANAAAAGAVGAIIFNNRDGEIPYEIPGMAVPTIKMDDDDGRKILAELEKGNNKVSFDIEFDRQIDETVADFSSRGPVMDTWMIKPDVSAPGVNIVSTVPTHNPDAPHGYASYQGTSMASPHVAGAVALILEAHPTYGVDNVKAALMNTAENLYDPNGVLYPHNTQGAGSIRPLDAINADTLVTTGSHSFGVFYKDKGKQVEKQHFTIKNLSNKRKTYSFDVKFTGNPDGIKVMTSNNLRVNGNKEQQVNFNVQVDAGKLNPGYYEGTILVSDGAQSFEVPTILFVKEPDYPRITHFYVTETEAGYDLEVYLPGGADQVGLWVYTADTFDYVGGKLLGTDASKEFTSYSWDGKINGESLKPGEYYFFAYAEKDGQLDYVYTIVEVK